jgi:peptidoglycan/LPS O-acetylase OafA/YrhL
MRYAESNTVESDNVGAVYTTKPVGSSRNKVGDRLHVPALDGVRGIAILAVMAFHFSLGNLKVLGPVFSAGWAGVDLFFALSGFLITGILNDARGTEGYFLNFYARRTLRIFPLYFGVLAVVFLLLPRFVPLSSVDMVSPGGERPFWLYYSNFAIYLFGWPAKPMAHFWSLAVEEQFYLLWPLVVWCLPPKRQLYFCISLITGVELIRVAAVLLHVSYTATAYLTPFRIDVLAAGALGSIAVRLYPKSSYKIARRLLAVAGLFLVGVFIARSGFSLLDYVFRLVGYPLLTAFCAAFVVTASASGMISSLASVSVLKQFGKYSYGMYVYHQLLIHCWEHLFPVRKLGLLGFAALSMCATCAIAYLSWHLFEVHFLKLKRFFVAA